MYKSFSFSFCLLTKNIRKDVLELDFFFVLASFCWINGVFGIYLRELINKQKIKFSDWWLHTRKEKNIILLRNYFCFLTASAISNLLKCSVYPFVQAYSMGINLIFLRDIKVNGPEEVLLKYLSSFSYKFGQREVRIFGIIYTEKLWICKASFLFLLLSQAHKQRNCSQTVTMSLSSTKSPHHFYRYNNLTSSVANASKTLHDHHFENNSELMTLNAVFLQCFEENHHFNKKTLEWSIILLNTNSTCNLW